MTGQPKRQKRIREPRATYQAEKRSTVTQSRAKPDKRVLQDWQWVQENRPWLEKQYTGRWIAVSGKRMVGTGAKLSGAMKQARRAGIEHPFVTAFKAAKYRGMVEVPHWL